MNTRSILAWGIVFAVASFAFAPGASAQWVNFVNETPTRMGIAANNPATSTTDTEEKDYAWGDIDQDGDIDLVCVRKQPFTSPGRRVNILFVNEGIAQGHSINGVLVDRTNLYATAVDMNNDGITDPSATATDFGFNTPTNDRDVVLTDINNDGWLDIVTAVTLSDGQPKHISHPRVYINLKEVGGAWQGFRYEPHRIPNLVPPPPVNQNATPRFCSVAAGDVTGDGYVDLYFGDYNSSGTSGMPHLHDFDNHLLINGGAANPGVFTNSGNDRISASKRLSAFGAASIIADMNNDGALDIVKQTSLANPTHVAIHHNDPLSVGNFPDPVYKMVNQNAPYFVSAGDLNNDGRLDLVTSDDGSDRYMLNTGNAADGTANFNTLTFSFTSGGDDGFASQSAIADLNNDGWNDVLISDVDVDIGGCGRRMHIYRNLGNAPNVTLQEQPIDGLGNSTATMGGTHNVAVFDINGDGWKDLVIGRCTGTQVWINVPPAGIAFAYPQGLPAFITPGETTTFTVQLTGISGAQIARNSAKMFHSIDGAPFVQTNLTALGGNLFEATLPSVQCADRVRFYLSANLQAGGTKFDPPAAPTQAYLGLAAIGTEITLEDNIEGSIAGWGVSNSAGLTAGLWEQADPNVTFFAQGLLASPEDDATGGSENVKAFVTQNGSVGGAPGAADIDDGSTTLTSPLLDLADSDATISYSRWFFSSLAGNSLTTQVSNNDGGSWATVETINATIADASQVPPETTWQTTSFIVGQYVTPTAQVRVRFIASGAALNSVAEAGIDNFQVQKLLCDQPCPADVSGDQTVNVTDLLAVISAWGPCGGCSADTNDDGNVNVTDLLAVISAWGACP